jgi:hypothetical protein
MGRTTLFLALLMLAGCTHTGATSDPGAPGGAVALPTPTTVPTVAVTLANHTSEVICSVYITPAGGSRGDNLLGAGAVVLPGQAATFHVPPGTYSLRADNCFDVPLAEEQVVRVLEPLGWRIVTTE